MIKKIDIIQRNSSMRNFLFLTLAVLLGFSCKSKQIFLEQNRVHLEEQGIEITRVQFYVDKDLVLRRELDSHETHVTNGEIKQIDGQRTEEIRIMRGTPGVIEQVDAGKLWITFETREGCALRFLKNVNDAYQVDADKWYERRGEVKYDGKTFYMLPPHNDAMLMVRKNELYKPDKDSRRAKGVRIDSNSPKRRRRGRVKRGVTPQEDTDWDSSGTDDWAEQ